ncbi:MAG: glycoside hydrolase family 130 protein [Planctomycetota bacterium]
MPITRFEENPLIKPADIKPYLDGFDVVCTFNAGCTVYQDEILLLLRVAERPIVGPHEIVAPVFQADAPSPGIHLIRVTPNDPEFEEIDSRLFRYQGITYLTSISHLRMARSKNGRDFVVDEVPTIFAETAEEEFGIEDPRITKIGEDYYINYTAVSRKGIATALARTNNFETFERMGIIFAPENRDVTVFPEKIGGRYFCYHRPVAKAMERADIWLAYSDDLVHWGNHSYVCGTRPGMWDSLKTGGGAVPIKTKQGWLSIYHGADDDQRYSLGIILADLEDPGKILARSKNPLLEPKTEYEKTGFFGQVIFTCGAIAESDGRVIIYYGAADEYTCAAETTIDYLLDQVQ